MTYVRSMTHFQDKLLQSFRVYEDSQVYLYLTTSTVLDNFSLDIEPEGSIDNINVVSIQTLFDYAEVHQPELAEALTVSVDYQREEFTINNHKVIAYVYEDGTNIELNSLINQCRTIPKGRMLSVLKACSISLDGSSMLKLNDAVSLLKMFGRKTNRTKLKNRGFG